MASKTREPLIHISRRSALPWYQSWAVRAGALILSLAVCALVTMFTTGENPLNVFGAIYEASFSTPRRTWVLFQNIAMLLSVSLAVVPAFKMRFWNLGGEGPGRQYGERDLHDSAAQRAASLGNHPGDGCNQYCGRSTLGRDPRDLQG